MGNPLIMLLDIDGTIIGEILPQVMEWQLLLEYKKESIRQFRSHLIETLKGALVRPGITTFMETITKNMHVEFFIYTASEHKWANFLVPCIEAAMGVTFNRPILTRNHLIVNQKSGVFQKSIAKNLPILNRSLKRSGHHPVTLNQCIMIDNNETLVEDEMSRLVLCSTYKYILFQDVLRFIPFTTVQANLNEIAEQLKDNNMLPIVKKTLNIDNFIAHYYEKLGKSMALKYKSNKEKDKMWYVLAKIMAKQFTGEQKELKDIHIKTVSKKLVKFSLKQKK